MCSCLKFSLPSGPDLVAFLKKPGQKQITAKGGGATSCPVLTTAAPLATPAALVVPPEKGWLHMDVLEKEKLEWVTDLPTTHSKPEMDKVKSRFSLDGIVISRSEELPFHLGLHHHGDEPEVGVIFSRNFVVDSVSIFPGSWLYFGRAFATL